MIVASAVVAAARRGLGAFAPKTWTRMNTFRRIGALLAAAVCTHVAHRLLAPMLADLGAMGQHDWDSEAAYRYITPLSILKYHELPWWHPYFCGGFPAWGYGEMATNLVSPILPAYLLMPVPAALRVEIVFYAALSLFATWLLAGRFTKNAAVRALVAIVYSLNGRYALQISSGHAWHMQYAWTPLVLYFFDRAVEPNKLRKACWAGAFMAMVVYGGGIYPLPHTAIAIVVYAFVLAITRKSLRALYALAITGLTSVGLAAPKLLPIWEVMQRWPRTIASLERATLEQVYEMLANPNQTFSSGPFFPSQWGWHEWGIYAGPVIVGCMLLALFGSGDERFTAARAVGFLFFCLGFGTFNQDAPWTVLHLYPPFSSQHVPSRFLYVGVLMMMVSFAAMCRRPLAHLDRRAPLVGLLLFVPVWWIGLDVADVGKVATSKVFYMQSPKITPYPQFVQFSKPEFDYIPEDSRAGASLLAMERNEGFVECDNVPNNAQPRGAIAQDNPAYKGEAYVAGGPGTAKVVEWTPNRAVVDVSGVKPGATVVYNMNWDPGWTANGTPALAIANAVATQIPTDHGRIEFKYRPRTMGAALAIFLLTLLCIFATSPAFGKLRPGRVRSVAGYRHIARA
jgi:hypothetical protein